MSTLIVARQMPDDAATRFTTRCRGEDMWEPPSGAGAGAGAVTRRRDDTRTPVAAQPGPPAVRTITDRSSPPLYDRTHVRFRGGHWRAEVDARRPSCGRAAPRVGRAAR